MIIDLIAPAMVVGKLKNAQIKRASINLVYSFHRHMAAVYTTAAKIPPRAPCARNVPGMISSS